MIIKQDFVNATLGGYFDVDGAFGAQCWDLFAYFCQQNGKRVYNCTQSGYVKDLWYTRYDSGILNDFDEIPNNALQFGDWAIWDAVSPQTPYSHIAMFIQDNGNGTGEFLGQNQFGVANATKVTMRYTGLLGGFRLKGTPPVIVEPPYQPVFSVGDNVEVVMNSWLMTQSLNGEHGGDVAQGHIDVIDEVSTLSHPTHPYHLKDVMGWVREEELKRYVEPIPTPTSEVVQDRTVYEAYLPSWGYPNGIVPYIKHTVVEGESLQSIAEANGYDSFQPVYDFHNDVATTFGIGDVIPEPELIHPKQVINVPLK